MKFRCPPYFILRKLYPGFQWFSYSVLFGIVILGASLTVLLYRNERKAREQWLHEKFREETEADLALLQKAIEHNMNDIATVAALCQASHTVNRQEFSALTRQLLSRNPCAQALQWLQRVTDAERDAWEAAARREIAPGFQITERSPHHQMVRAARRPEYYAIFYCEPRKGNEAAIGYDPSSEPTRRTALEKSVDTGEAISSDWVHLVQGNGSELGFVISVPVYRNDLPCRTVEERRRAMKGFAVGVIKVQQVFNAALGSRRKPGIEIQVDDLSAYSALPANVVRLGTAVSSGSEGAGAAPQFKEVRNVKVADHAWRIQFASTPAFFSQLQRENPLRTPLLGISITAILGAYLYFLLNRAEHARRQQPVGMVRAR
jgi:CHASE1-domain containing sensor protein